MKSIIALSLCLLFSEWVAADQMVGKSYDGEVQECYTARQNISTNPTLQALDSSVKNVCIAKGGSKVAHKIEKIKMTDVNTVIFICYKEINSGLTPLFGCRYYLTGFAL